MCDLKATAHHCVPADLLEQSRQMEKPSGLVHGPVNSHGAALAVVNHL